ncbi:MAG: chemotaxis protein [Salinarimonas sp.]|nr:chemotaxis protein [Salinarimonas sp.]
MTTRLAPNLRGLMLGGAGLIALVTATAPAGAESEARIAAREATREAQIAQERRDESREPYAMLRTLQSLQERIAHGDVRAHEGQRALITRVAETFLRADPAVFADPRNANAAISFVLGGGPPIVLERMLALDPAPAVEPDLLAGALAYVHGREEDARERLAGFDPRALPGYLGAQVAIARSALIVREDPKEAVRLLSLARLLAPGTLAEEAALRREIFVEGQRGELERLEFLAVQYLRRYRNSVYAGNFRQRFITLLATLDFAESVEDFLRLETVLAHMDGEGKRDLYLFFARHALLSGRLDLARLASERAMGFSAGDSDEEERARFYFAAGQIVTQAYEPAVEILLALDPERLPEADIPVLEAAMATAAAIGEPLHAIVGVDSARDEDDAEDEPGEDEDAERAGEEADETVVAEDAAEADAQGETAVADTPTDSPPETALAAALYPKTPVMQRALAALDEIDLLLEGQKR